MANSKYGCYNRQLVTRYPVPVRDIDNAGNLVGYKVIALINTMSKDCRYDLRSTDVRCSGCKWIRMNNETHNEHVPNERRDD